MIERPIPESIIRDYYNTFNLWYEKVWNEQIHTGLFDREKSLDQAVRDTNSYMADKAGINPGDRIVNMGCGKGGVDRFLAKDKGALVTGVDLSEEQLAGAMTKAREAGLEGQINYVQGSMTALPLEDGSQNIIWAQESFFYNNEKERTTAEFARVLQENGKVVLEDTTLEDPSAGDEVYTKFCRRAVAPGLLTHEQYMALFKDHDFEQVFSENWSNYLAQTYRQIIEKVRNHAEEIKQTIPQAFLLTKAANNDFGFPESLKLVEEGKLGCRFMIFQKGK